MRILLIRSFTREANARLHSTRDALIIIAPNHVLRVGHLRGRLRLHTAGATFSTEGLLIALFSAWRSHNVGRGPWRRALALHNYCRAAAVVRGLSEVALRVLTIPQAQRSLSSAPCVASLCEQRCSCACSADAPHSSRRAANSAAVLAKHLLPLPHTPKRGV